MFILEIILAILFSIVSGISKSIADLSSEGKIKGNPKYWVKSVSSNNKWKNGDPKQGEKFWLSSKQLVFLTDAWHLFGLFERIGFVVTYVSVGLLIATSPWYFFMILCYPLSMLVFDILHDETNIMRKK